MITHGAMILTNRPSALEREARRLVWERAAKGDKVIINNQSEGCWLAFYPLTNATMEQLLADGADILAAARKDAGTVGHPPRLCCYYESCDAPACRREECGWPAEEAREQVVDIYREPQ